MNTYSRGSGVYDYEYEESIKPAPMAKFMTKYEYDVTKTLTPRYIYKGEDEIEKYRWSKYNFIPKLPVYEILFKQLMDSEPRMMPNELGKPFEVVPDTPNKIDHHYIPYNNELDIKPTKYGNYVSFTHDYPHFYPRLGDETTEPEFLPEKYEEMQMRRNMDKIDIEWTKDDVTQYEMERRNPY
jgi:hypothetical protein